MYAMVYFEALHYGTTSRLNEALTFAVCFAHFAQRGTEILERYQDLTFASDLVENSRASLM